MTGTKYRMSATNSGDEADVFHGVVAWLIKMAIRPRGQSCDIVIPSPCAGLVSLLRFWISMRL
jgi:hypothetical protein